MTTVQHAAASANPLTAATAPTAASVATDADAAGAATALPWIAALQDALAQLKGTHVSATPAAGKHKAAAGEDSAAEVADKATTPADATADGTAVNPLALLATLPPQPAQTQPVKAAGESAHEPAQALARDDKKAPALPDVKAESKPESAPVHAAPVDAKELEFAAAVEKAVQMNGQAAQHESRMLDSVASTLAQSHTQAPAAAPAQAHDNPVQLQVNATVASPAWNTELGHKVVFMVSAKEHVAELHLNPPELGPLDIKLTVSGNETTAVFTSPHGAVRDAVESALPRLREVLAESGVMLGNASVTSDTPRDGSAFANQDGSAGRSSFGSGTGDSTTGPAPSAAPIVVRPRGLVDLFA